MTKPLTYNLPHSTQFADKWEEWVKYRTELKKPYKTQKGVTMALNRLGAMSEIDAISMIDHSMSNEYQGLYGDGKKKEKGEIDPIYKEQPQPKLSPYQAKPYNQDIAIQHMKDKLKANYESGSFINDMGGIYTHRLKDLIEIPTDIRIAIEMEEEHEATRPRNRFEEQYLGSIESDTRDAKLNWWLKKSRLEGRDLSLEL